VIFLLGIFLDGLAIDLLVNFSYYYTMIYPFYGQPLPLFFTMICTLSTTTFHSFNRTFNHAYSLHFIIIDGEFHQAF
jgi:hypothetical protein